ncbi:MAG: peptidase M75 [Tannerella sp.]|jgi:predicted lipoprotein|nr:peptidase M75 [Tannerella sp.]
MKTSRFTIYLLFAVLSVNGFVACDKNEMDPFTEKENALAPIIPQYVNHTVIATYRSLADATIDLYQSIDNLKKEKTAAHLNTATQSWIKTRAHWELSEAFLFGAVADFGIDPHIDTWPLDEVTFVQTINNSDFIESMDADDGDVWAADHLGFALLGFHGIEYILFRDGAPKEVDNITDGELIYAHAVAGDLRNQCVRLEASWAGIDAITAEKKQLIEDLELAITPSNSPISYGENMLLAGEPGSTYRTVANAVAAIISGCIDISDEVGDVKIGTAYNKDDVNYIESPYSYNSKVDFTDNIKSIENAYLGGADASKRGASISDYIKSVDAELDASVRSAITNAIAKINAIPYPFAKNYASAEAGTALNTCQDLTETLEKVKSAIEE